MHSTASPILKDLVPILACPQCKIVSIEIVGDGLACNSCHRKYPFVDGILDFASQGWEGGTSEIYGNISFMYDFIVPRIGMPIFGYGINDLKSLIGSGLDRHREGWILDAPSGTGFFTLDSLRQEPNARVACLDLSFEMLKRARNRVEKWGLEDRVVLIRGDILSMPFAPKAFGTGFCVNGLHSISARQATLSEFRRCLREGGRLHGNVFVKSSGAVRRRWLAYGVAHNAFADPLNEDEYLSLFAQAGFEVVESHMKGAGFFFSLLRN